ncbi:phosphopantetheine-binding protein, partial [Burkholderia multivorans]|uniref:phosphopantetheine-binding protein n=1 Tax=Burkholderia multivorans TaxID=87883 RepID=UPI000DB69598
AAGLAALWSDTFAIAAPAPDADLFEAGATSFDVVRFVDAACRAEVVRERQPAGIGHRVSVRAHFSQHGEPP